MVGWKDVGGQKGVKMQLMEAVEWPQKHQDAFRHIGTRPPSVTLNVAMQITPMVGWKDVGGQKGVKMQLMEAVEWPQKHQDAFRHIGTRPPSGVLLFGPPGCSKTLLAHAVKPKNGVVVLKYVDHGTIDSCSGAASHF
ncbi:calmodulin-interacting protein 111 isoform X1 [Tanacetum coccineum]